jgi:dTDP-4-amino-4,6-dideoxygalactose transaminase
MKCRPFASPIYVTKPILPDLDRFRQSLGDIWDSGWLTNNGRKHQELEKRLQTFLNVPALSLFNNGTIALIVALQSLDLKGEVITTPFTFPASVHVLMWNRLTPVFCDIDPHTMNIDPRRMESLITPRTTAILGVHVYGTPCDVSAIDEIADRHSLNVVYDSAHAFGVEIDGQGIGKFGDMSMFSFHATKLFHTAEGGALAVNDAEAKARIDLLKNFGIRDEEQVILPGINGKMNELQAALGIAVLEEYEAEWRRRKALYEVYVSRLEGVDGLTLMHDDRRITKASYQYFVVRIDEKVFGASRDMIHEELKEYNIFTRKYFYPLCSQYDCYKDLPSAQAKKLPVANTVSREVLCLPFYGALRPDDVRQICDILLSLRGATE